MTLYEECLEALKDYEEFSVEDSSKLINEKIINEIEFTWYERINFDKYKNKVIIESFTQLDSIVDRYVFVFWDIEEHLIKTKMRNIINAWDDVSCLGTRTWIISVEFDFFLEYYSDLVLGYKD